MVKNMEIKINKITETKETAEVLFELWHKLGNTTVREMGQGYRIHVEIVPLEDYEPNE